MISLIVIVLGVALNILPADVRSFVITTPERETIRYERQSDGGWEVTPRTEDGARFFARGTQLTIRAGGKEMAMDLAEVLGVTEDTDWASIKNIRYGDRGLAIQRPADGLDITIRPGQQHANGAGGDVYQVRWDKRAK